MKEKPSQNEITIINKESEKIPNIHLNIQPILEIWENRKKALHELASKYDKYCDNGVRCKIQNIVIPYITTCIEGLPNKLNSELTDEHQKLLKTIIKESDNDEVIRSIKDSIKRYKSYPFDMSRDIKALEESLDCINEFNSEYSKIHTYYDYFSMKNVRAARLSDGTGATESDIAHIAELKSHIDELRFKIDYHFLLKGWNGYYSVMAELIACKHFEGLGFKMENATCEKEGGVDLKIIDTKTHDTFFVEVYCPDVYYEDGDELIDCLITSGCSMVQNDKMADILRKKILPDEKKSHQILDFAKKYPNKKVYLWIDLTRWVENTQLKSCWLKPSPSDALCKIFYNQQLVYDFNSNDFDSGKSVVAQENNIDICDKLTGLICYSDSDKKIKYIHNPAFKIINPMIEFPIGCDYYYFQYEEKFISGNKEEIAKYLDRK